MTTEQALDQMTLLAPHFAAILDDEDAAEVVKAIRDEKGDLPAGSTMQKLLPLFTGKHREHLFHIAAITEGKPVEEIRERPVMELIRGLQKAMLEETLLLFMVCMRIVRNI